VGRPGEGVGRNLQPVSATLPRVRMQACVPSSVDKQALEQLTGCQGRTPVFPWWGAPALGLVGWVGGH
jgi:hypothetical protein